MKLSQKTITLMKNLASINTNLYFNAGESQLATVDGKSPTVLCRAIIDETFDKDFGIYELSDFLGAISLFDDVEIELDDTHCMLYETGSKRKKLKYFGAEKSCLILPPANEIPIADEDKIVSFVLSDAELKNIVRAASLMKLDSIAIGVDEDRVSVGAKNSGSGSTTTNNYSVDLDESDVVRGDAFNGTFEISIDKLNLNPISGCDYKVTVTSRVIRFDTVTGSEYDVTYWYSPRKAS